VISRNEVYTYINNGMSEAMPAQLALVSSLNRGVIEDIDLSGDLWSNTQGMHAVAGNNESGIVRRVISRANINVYDDISVLQDTQQGRISAGVGVNTNGGTVQDLFFINSPVWRSIPSFFLSSNANGMNCDISFNYDSSPSLAGNPLLGSLSDFSVVNLSTASSFEVLNVSTSNNPDIFTIDIPANGCGGLSQMSEFASLEWVAASESGTGLKVNNGDLSNTVTYNNNWNYLNLGISQDQEKLVSIYLAHLSGQALPYTPPVWEFEPGQGMRLFRLDD
jgi:hypothetical protein